MVYIYELDDWPDLRWRDEEITKKLAALRHRQGRFIGHMEMLGFALQKEAELQTLTEDVLKSSEIEGEILNRDQVRSSIANRLGIEFAGLVLPEDRNVEGVVEMMLDATQNYEKPLTIDRLQNWHAVLFPTGWSGMNRIRVGVWRNDEKGPMQVVSGPIGREKVHYEAPSHNRLENEMSNFLNWFEKAQPDPVLKAGIAHLWFVTIHPFDDGNGRIARAIADLALARSEATPQRFYSMSAQIRAERNKYYEMLERTQKGDLDITVWLLWFIGCLDRAFDRAEETLASVRQKAQFWESVSNQQLNDRQKKVINKLLDGFEGKLTNAKWAALTKTSSDTALRDINDLIQRGILVKDPQGGRSTGYSLAPRDAP